MVHGKPQNAIPSNSQLHGVPTKRVSTWEYLDFTIKSGRHIDCSVTEIILKSFCHSQNLILRMKVDMTTWFCSGSLSLIASLFSATPLTSSTSPIEMSNVLSGWRTTRFFGKCSDFVTLKASATCSTPLDEKHGKSLSSTDGIASWRELETLTTLSSKHYATNLVFMIT